MYRPLRISATVALVAFLIPTCASRAAFIGNFIVSDLAVISPYQADSSDTTNTTVTFTFGDQDTPEVSPPQCTVEWPAGLSPSNAYTSSCDNDTFSVRIPDDTYHGVGSFIIDLTHSYIDNSVGEYPYNVNTKFSPLNLTYPATANYECDLSTAQCQSCAGTTIVAVVTESWA